MLSPPVRVAGVAVLGRCALRRFAMGFAAVFLVAVVAGCGAERAATTAGGAGDAALTERELRREIAASDGQVPGSINTWPSSGVAINTVMRFSESRHVEKMELKVGGTISDDVGFYPASYVDEIENGNEPLDEFDVAAGEKLFVQGSLAPSCAEEPDDSPPVLLVSFTRGGGGVEVERLEVLTVEDGESDGEYRWAPVAQVVRAWCEAGVQAIQASGSMSTDGDARVTYEVLNPGPGDVTLTSRAGAGEGTMRWKEAGPVNLPAGETVVIHVEGKADQQGAQRVAD